MPLDRVGERRLFVDQQARLPKMASPYFATVTGVQAGVAACQGAEFYSLSLPFAGTDFVNSGYKTYLYSH